MNPKDKVGQAKVCVSNCPIEVVLEVACALTEGKLKYGRYNWRHTNVNVCVYTDAAIRHISSYIVGEDIDPDSGLHHITKAIASLVVLRDAILHDCANDDRPPNGIQIQGILNEKVATLIEKYETPTAPTAPTAPEFIEGTAGGVGRWRYHVTEAQMEKLDSSFKRGYCRFDNLCCAGRLNHLYSVIDQDGTPSESPSVFADTNIVAARASMRRSGKTIRSAMAVLK